MAIIPFIRAACPIWLLNDLTGNLLDDTYFVFFLENTLPYLPKGVYQNFSATLPWPNPLQVQADGTLPNNLYFDGSPDSVYRIEIRNGPTQADALIRLVENFVPGAGGDIPVSDGTLESENQVSNAQFFDVNFRTDIVFTVTPLPATPIQIAPGWELSADVGVTSVTISQTAYAGVNNIVNNPSYALTITSAGAGNLTLRQKFNNNGALWNQKAIGMNITAKSTSSIVLNGRIIYSDGQNFPIIVNKLMTANYVEISKVSPIAAPSVNPQLPSVAFTALEFVWAAPGTVDFTNVQLIVLPLTTPTTTVLEYVQETLERQVDHEFHYYKPKLAQKPIPSWLVGWDFPLNPSQFFANGTVPAQTIGSINKSFYAWDQTIVFQSVDTSVSIARAASGAFVMTAALTGKMAVIQYIDPPKLRSMLLDSMSINIAAYTSAASPITAAVELYYTLDTNLPAMGSNNSLVASLNSDGTVNTNNGTWVKIPRINNMGTAIFKIQTKVDQEFFDYNFNGWDLDGVIAATTANYSAIVIGTASVTQNDTISLLSVALMSGDIATRPAPQTKDHVLQECERYYEKSYRSDDAPATLTDLNCKTAPMWSDHGGPNKGYPITFGLEYKLKRANPTLTFYSPSISNAAGLVRFEMNLNNGYPAPTAGTNPTTYAIAGNWAEFGKSLNRVELTSATTSTSVMTMTAVPNSGFAESIINYHFVADARLGIVN